jgi:outer membrane PBP1 activator LpoA protein
VLARYWGTGAERRARFYAMGYDAYYLTALLNGRTTTGALAMNGMTGKIFMDDQGRLHRDLRWARMERGRPRTLPEVIPSLSQEAEVIISQQ